jgi:hypothetical protein
VKARIMRTLIPVFLLAVVGLRATRALAQSPTLVGVVVALGDGTTQTRCVNLEGDKVSGYDVLMASGLEVKAELSGAGITICSIGGQGCPADNCFCECQGGECAYWSYWHLQDGAWVYSIIGAAGYTVEPGSVEGWSWGDAPPPVLSLAQICAPPTATPTADPTWTPTTAPTATSVPPTTTPVPPTHTPVPVAAGSESEDKAATAIPPETFTPTLIPATTTPTATVTATTVPTHALSPTPDVAEGRSWNSYWAFGGIVAALLVVGFLMMRRR